MACEGLTGRSMTRAQRIRALRLLGQALGLMGAAASLSGWTSWVVLGAVPVALAALREARGAEDTRWAVCSSAATERVALCLGIMLEMMVVRRHGLRALVSLLAVPLLWSTKGAWRAAAAGLLAVSAWLARPRAVTSGVLWAAAGATGLFEGLGGLRTFARVLSRPIGTAPGRKEGDAAARGSGPGGADAGQAMLETALTLPIILLALIGAVQFGMLFSEHIFLQAVNGNVAQAAARLGGNPVSGELQTVIDNSFIAWLDPSMTHFTVDTLEPDGSLACDGGATPHCTCEYGDLVRVTGEYDTALHILAFSVNLTLETQSCLFCWRGGYTP